MAKKIIASIIVLGFLFGAIFYYFYLSTSKKHIEPPQKIVLGVESSILPSAVWIAENKGYFLKHGLDVAIKEFESGRLSFVNMLEGGVDISTVAPTPIMFNSFDRQDFYIFSTFVHSYEDVKVIARKDKGISSALDLKGKKIGTPASTTGQFFLSSFLVLRGMLDSDVEVLDISPADLPKSLNKGEVDAVVIWEPHAYNTQKLSEGDAIRLPSSDVYMETFNFMVMKDFANRNTEILKKFMKAIDEATEFIKNNKKESQNIVAKRLILDEDSIASLWDDFEFEISLEQSLILTLEDEARWAIKNNLTESVQVPNYLDYIYFEALENVKPKAISIIR